MTKPNTDPATHITIIQINARPVVTPATEPKESNPPRSRARPIDGFRLMLSGLDSISLDFRSPIIRRAPKNA